ncbi:HAD hydrolase-like protein, partial [Staphylococcus aureus]|uniref:HAD hydrolase-like protein n=1 Tax=Staphylococcus aureus TaxID=1280 RepID=UPI0016428F6C
QPITTFYNQAKKLFLLSSNNSDLLQTNLSPIPLNHFITQPLPSHQLTPYKPNPQPIHTILQPYNLNTQQTLYIPHSTF